jgi:hypothetical protein
MVPREKILMVGDVDGSGAGSLRIAGGLPSELAATSRR